MKKTIFTLLSASACCVACAAFDIGAAMETAEFWKSDPVMFVKRHQEEGFRFTSSDRESADTRLDGAVTYHDIPVFESKNRLHGGWAWCRARRADPFLARRGGIDKSQKDVLSYNPSSWGDQ
jgi:hypothetical protein